MILQDRRGRRSLRILLKPFVCIVGGGLPDAPHGFFRYLKQKEHGVPFGTPLVLLFLVFVGFAGEFQAHRGGIILTGSDGQFSKAGALQHNGFFHGPHFVVVLVPVQAQKFHSYNAVCSFVCFGFKFFYLSYICVDDNIFFNAVFICLLSIISV